MSEHLPETAESQKCGHVDWKRMYESAIKCAEEASKTSDHLRDLLDQLAPKWRSLDAPGRRYRPTGDVVLPPGEPR